MISSDKIEMIENAREQFDIYVAQREEDEIGLLAGALNLKESTVAAIWDGEFK